MQPHRCRMVAGALPLAMPPRPPKPSLPNPASAGFFFVSRFGGVFLCVPLRRGFLLGVAKIGAVATIPVACVLGYIGSHTCLPLAQAGYALVIFDSLVNSKRLVFDRLREIAPAAAMIFHQADLREADALDRIFSRGPIEAVIHFAGLKAV